MSESTSSYPTVSVDATGTGIVSHAGAVMLVRTADAVGLTRSLSQALLPWRKPLAHGQRLFILTQPGTRLYPTSALNEHRREFPNALSGLR